MSLIRWNLDNHAQLLFSYPFSYEGLGFHTAFAHTPSSSQPYLLLTMDLSMLCKSGSFPFQSPHSCMNELYKWASVAPGSTVGGRWCGMNKPLGLGMIAWREGLCICDWVKEREIVVTLFCVTQVGLMWPQKSFWKARDQGGHNWYHNGKRGKSFVSGCEKWQGCVPLWASRRNKLGEHLHLVL